MSVDIIKVNMGKSNAYLINGNSGLILVDAGMPKKTNKLCEILNKNNFKIKDISLIIVTHVHNDHVGSLYEIKKRSNAKILIHKNEVNHLKSGYTKFPKGTFIFSKIISKFANNLLFSKNQFKPVKADIIIEDSFDLNEYGVNGEVFYTPGHTNGSISVIVDNKHLIVGDTLFNWFPNSVYPPFANNKEKLIKSWKNIKNLNCEYFYPGHGNIFKTEKFEKSLNKYL
ncbi:MAG: MBL fold metallo-hydrolase [Bacillota bacterium]